MPKIKKFLHHLLLPHESNNHKAKLLHHSSLALLILFLLVSTFVISYTEKNYQEVLGIDHSVVSEQLLTETNLRRQEQGLPPLTMSSELSNAAAGKASDMFTNNYWAHTSPNGTTPWVFIRGSGYEYIFAGENLARGFTTSQDVVNAWMASEGHRANILSGNYKDIGFAISVGELNGEETVLVVQMFGSRTSPSMASDTKPVDVAVAPAKTEKDQEQEVSDEQEIKELVLEKQPDKDIVQTPKVESVANKPLVDSRSLTKNIALGIVILLFIILVLDIYFVERKQIIRAFKHNLDHLIFVFVILALILIITRGGVL